MGRQVKTRDYQRDLQRTLRGCIIDAIIWGVLTLMFLCLGLYSGFSKLPKFLERYRLSVMLICYTAALALGIKGLQSLSEIVSIKDVIKRSVYAVMLTQKQQNRIFRSVGRQSFLEHLTYFLFGAVPVTAIMLVLYYNSGDTSPLFAMGILDGIILFGTLLAYGLDVSRLASQDGFVTVSDRGIISANEILPFSAKDGDIIKMLSFDDDYEIVFRRKCYLGITRKYTFPLPKDGLLSKDVEGDELEEVLLKTFGLIDAEELEGEYKEIRGEELAEQEREETEELLETEKIDSEVSEDEELTAETEENTIFIPFMEAPSAEPEEELIEEKDQFEELYREASMSEAVPTLVFNNEEIEVANDLESSEEQESLAESDEDEPDTLEAEEESEAEESEEDSVKVLFRDEEPAEVKKKKLDLISLMQASWMRKAAAVMAFLLVIVVAGTIIFKNNKQPSGDPTPGNNGQGTSPSNSVTPGGSSNTKEDEPFVDVLPKSDLQQDDDGVWYATIGGEMVPLVNKDHTVPENYGGVNEIATSALNEMIKAADADGVHIVFVSGYRSYALQESMYESKVTQVGETAAGFIVAPPGASEYQTGLAFDVDDSDSENTLLSINFEDTQAFKWLTEHCAEYGFILRYPKGAIDITGFNYEPWHYRYVGREVAKAITEAGITLEEYLGA